MAGILSKGIKFYTGSGTSPITYTEVANLQQIPDLGGDAEQVEVTCLADGEHRYIPGIKNYGNLEFTFLYDNSEATSNYRALKALADAGAAVPFKVELPDALTEGTGTHHGTEFTFTAIPNVKIASAAVNAALTFTLSLSLQSDIDVANPA